MDLVESWVLKAGLGLGARGWLARRAAPFFCSVSQARERGVGRGRGGEDDDVEVFVAAPKARRQISTGEQKHCRGTGTDITAGY